MVGIVLVSHSQKLVEGLCELAGQMVQGNVRLAAAGGIDDPENPIGTDAMKVLAAIESVYSDDGVVVLMDLGSALLSAEMAVEFLPPEQQTAIYLCEAPLVEGTVAAVVQASVGGDVAQVLAEARGALAVKAAQMPGAPQPGFGVATVAREAPLDEASHQRAYTIRNALGLHARPAAQFVGAANRFQATLEVRKGQKTANAKSINQVATLGVRQGDTIVVYASGPDAELALDALQVLVDDNFGEPEVLPETPAPVVGRVFEAAPGDVWSGIAASPGIALGPVFQYRATLPSIEVHTVADTEAEWRRLEGALATAVSEIKDIAQRTRLQVGAADAAIFDAHRLFLEDPDLLTKVRERLVEGRLNAEAAWQAAIEALAREFRQLDDPYMQARAADVIDVGQRVLRGLLQLAPPSLDLDEPVILIAPDLTPSDTARLDPALILGICTEQGGATSHSAILSRALGIPAVVGLGTRLAALEEGCRVALDGKRGWFWPTLNEETAGDLCRQREAWLAEQAAAKTTSQALAVTLDDRRLEVAANIGGPHDSAVALEYGAEGVGLFRTEFLFLDRASAPTEEEQFAAYRQVAEAMGDRPVIIRTLDVGGDKPLPYLDLGQEENPFLGWRGIRFCLDIPEVIRPQLRAVLRASAYGSLKLMFPMVSTVSEIRRARSLLADEQAALRGAGILFDERMEVGVMIEVPAAVAVADLLAREVDFFSIGTNDLTQYTMAADRGNPRVSGLTDALQPAVLRLVKQTVDAAHAAGIWVGICGELAGNPLAAPLLVGLGLDELSMSAPAIPAVKKAIRGLRYAEAVTLAETVLGLDTSEAVASFLSSRRP